MAIIINSPIRMPLAVSKMSSNRLDYIYPFFIKQILVYFLYNLLK